VRTKFVVVCPPAFQLFPRVGQTEENLSIQAFVAQSAVKARSLGRGLKRAQVEFLASVSPFRGLKELRPALSLRSLWRCRCGALRISIRGLLGGSFPWTSLSGRGRSLLHGWFLSLDTKAAFQHRFKEFLFGRRHCAVEVLRTPREQGVQFP
jgi:hypothetical protein